MRRHSRQGPHLGMMLETRGFSRVAAGFLSYKGDFWLPLVLAQGSPIFHSSCKGELEVALESLQGKRDFIQDCVQDLMFLSRDDWDLGVAFQTQPGVRRLLEGKQRTSLSSRVTTGISWSPLSGLKGVKPPVESGERTRDCTPGHTGKEGPHLTMTGGLGGFTELQRLCGFLRRYDGELREPLVWRQGSQVWMREARGSASLLSSHGRGIGPLDALKKDSQGLSRVATRIPGIP